MTMLKEMTFWSQKLQEGLTLAKDFMARYESRIPKNIKKIAFVGMGGSGIAGRIVKTFLDRKSGVSTVIIDSPELPENIGTDTLAIVVSYSGKTWETLSILSQLTDRFIPTVVLAHGGLAIEMCETKNIPFALLPYSCAPRAALGHFLGFLFGIFNSLKLLEGERKVNAFCKHAELYMLKFESPLFFDDFLSVINGYDFFHVWGVSGSSAAFAYRAQTQFNENSKVQAVFSSYPEVNHNLINGFDFFKINPCVLFFYTHFLPVNLLKNIDVTGEILKEKGVVLYKPPVFGNTFEEQLFNIILWSDFASYHLGKFRGVVIEEVKIIDRLKEKLRSKGIN